MTPPPFSTGAPPPQPTSINARRHSFYYSQGREGQDLAEQMSNASDNEVEETLTAEQIRRMLVTDGALSVGELP